MFVTTAKTILIASMLANLSTAVGLERMATGPISPTNCTKNLPSPTMYINDHRNFMDRKLSNYSLGVIKSTSGTNLDRAEDYFVEHLKADLSLNRYKVISD